MADKLLIYIFCFFALLLRFTAHFGDLLARFLFRGGTSFEAQNLSFSILILRVKVLRGTYLLEFDTRLCALRGALFSFCFGLRSRGLFGLPILGETVQ